MTLKTVLESLDGLDEITSNLYKEGESGNFILDVEGIDEHPSISTLKNAYERQKKATKEAKDNLKKLSDRFDGVPEDFDVEKYNEFIDWRDNPPEEGKPADQQQIEQLERRLETKHQRELDKLKKERDEAVSSREKISSDMNRTIINHELQKGLLAIDVNDPDLMEGASLIHGRKLKVVSEDDQFLVVADDPDLGEVPLKEYLQKWSESPQAKKYTTAAENSGGDTVGNPNAGRRIDTSKMSPQEKLKYANEHPNL